MTGIGNDREYCGRINLVKVHLGPGDAFSFCSECATSYRSVELFTGTTMGVMIFVNYSPIWKCEYLWESRELFQDVWMVSLVR